MTFLQTDRCSDLMQMQTSRTSMTFNIERSKCQVPNHDAPALKPSRTSHLHSTVRVAVGVRHLGCTRTRTPTAQTGPSAGVAAASDAPRFRNRARAGCARITWKGTNGVSSSWVIANFMFLTEGLFWLCPLTYFNIPKSARAYLFPQSIKHHYFCSGPISVDPICPQPHQAWRAGVAGAAAASPTRARGEEIPTRLHYQAAHAMTPDSRCMTSSPPMRACVRASNIFLCSRMLSNHILSCTVRYDMSHCMTCLGLCDL